MKVSCLTVAISVITNMSAFTLDSARKLWSVSVRARALDLSTCEYDIYVYETYDYNRLGRYTDDMWVPASVWVADILCMCGARPCASTSVPHPTIVMALISYCPPLINYKINHVTYKFLRE